MTCTPTSELPRSLSAANERVRCWVEQALNAGDISALDAVWWLSTHLAASAKVIHPVACRVLPEGRARVAGARVETHRLLDVLYKLDRHLTGDSRSTRASTVQLLEQLRKLLAEGAPAQRELLAGLDRTLTSEQKRSLCTRYTEAVLHGPTRPHPLVPPGGWLLSWAFGVTGRIDHLRDALDNRHIPIQRGRRLLPTTAWGQYLLGTVEPGAMSISASHPPAQRPSGR